jgi:geranylgeranyl reductase family protein
MENCDVLIVGGGPAGSSCARALKDAGLDVVILDKQTFPRDKVCAGWVTPAVMEELALDVEAYGQQNTLQPIQAFRTGLIGGEALTTRYPQPVSYGIRRREFDDYLLRRSGARLLLGQGVTELKREGKEWLVNRRLRAPLLIGAGGHFCPVARHLGAKLGSSESVVAAQEIEFELTPQQAAACGVTGEMPELYFCRDLLGYGWAFRKGRFLNIGLGREDNRKLSQHVAEFVAYLQQQGRIPADIPAHFKGHAYLLYAKPVSRKLFDDGAMLIGDAAGLAYPQSGEGIRTAVESGLLAAATAIEAQGDYGRAALAAYGERLQAQLGERVAAKGLVSHLPASLVTLLAARLLASHWFVRHVVLDRWFLHARPA